MHRVVFEEVTKRGNIDEGVVDCRNLDVRVVQRRSQDEPANTPEAIDAELYPANTVTSVRQALYNFSVFSQARSLAKDF